MTKQAIKLANRKGYMTIDEVNALADTAALVDVDQPTFLNIGAGSGTSAMTLSESRPDAHIHTVDISAGGPHGGLDNERKAFLRADRRVPQQLLLTSHEAAISWQGQPIDLIHIDDGHLYDEIYNDIILWRPHMQTGGYMVFHDYGSNDWPAVKEVVDNLMFGCEMVTTVDTLIAFRLPQ